MDEPGQLSSVPPACTEGEALLAQVKRLDGELGAKTRECALMQEELVRLREELVACTNSMKSASRQLNDATTGFGDEIRHHLELMKALELEARMLERSNEAWSNRSLALQAELLKAREGAEAAKAANEKAALDIARLEVALKAAKAELAAQGCRVRQ